MTDAQDGPKGRLIPVDPELAASDLQGEPFADPAPTAKLFLDALVEGSIEYRTALLTLTTEESHATWGDFTEAAALLKSMGQGWGIGSRGRRPTADTAHVVVMKDDGMGESYYVDGDDVAVEGATVSLVHRPDLRGWLVHGFGDPFTPDEMPRVQEN